MTGKTKGDQSLRRPCEFCNHGRGRIDGRLERSGWTKGRLASSSAPQWGETCRLQLFHFTNVAVSEVLSCLVLVGRFPTQGGTGHIWKSVAKLLPEEKQSYGANYGVVGIDADAKTVTLASGATIQYNSLISTLPLDIMCRWLGRDDWADRLSHSSSHIIGLGIRGTAPHGKKCWLYYPEDDCPFYRTTVFSHYAEKNCPETGTKLPTLCTADGSAPANAEPQEGPYWSLMFEVSESASFKPVNQEPVTLAGAAGTWPKVVQETIQGAINTQLVQSSDEIVSIYYRCKQHPTPFLPSFPFVPSAPVSSRIHWSIGCWGHGFWG